MSASQHIEWLNLVEKTGPFLAVGVLDDAFPQGLEKVETRKRQRVRSAYEEWRDAVDKPDPDLDALHREWVRLVLEELLEYEPAVLKPADQLPATLVYREPLTGAEVKPDFAVLSGDKARLLVARYAPDTALSAPLAGQTWAASPVERMIALCRATGVRVGLITDGEQWTLVSVPADGASSLGTWYARIWQQETVTLQAFVSLLGVRRCFGPAEGTPETLFARSLEHQNEVTDTLGEQVRRAVEVLVQALDRADLDRDRQLLKDVSPAQLYEAGLTVMMRLVVLLCAEERKLLLLGEPIYDQHYAVSTLRARLREDKERLGDEVLERRHDAWARLLAVFRAVYGGIEHETLRLPPLGGSLLDPDRFPFLEGRAAGTSWRSTPASPLPIDNRTVLMLLTALQVLEQRTGALLLSYEALDVEQIGHVYEGLLERTVARVPETTLGLTGSQKAINPNVPLRELEEAKAQGDDKHLAFLLEKTGRSESGLKNALAKKVDEALYHRVLLACGGDIPLADRLKPWAHLLRTDSWGDPLAYREDSFIVTLGAGRRETGTHYTPKSLTEPIVQHTLEPLVYVGPAEGKPQPEWRLKSPREILALKVCDMAMGSAAFLVQTCRWLADRLVEAWDVAEKSGHQVSIEGEVLEKPATANASPSPPAGAGGLEVLGKHRKEFVEGEGPTRAKRAGASESLGRGEVGKGNSAPAPELLPRDKAERVLIARRLIASRCLYGVDKNPMAVELAKVSLWLVTLMKGRPFSFLDHALKCGDSLLGVSSLIQIENFSLRPGDRQVTFATSNLFRYVDEADKKRRELENLPSNDYEQIQAKTRLNAEAETATAKVKAVGDCLIAFELRGLDGDAYEAQRAIAADHAEVAMRKSPPEFLAYAREQLRGRRPFHWPVEYPEVFGGGGFDVVIGNPPYRHGSRISSDNGTDYLRYLVAQNVGVKGTSDLVVYFLRRSVGFCRSSGTIGLVTTKSIAEGDNKKSGFGWLFQNTSFRLYDAIKMMNWPGEANLLVSIFHGLSAEWCGEIRLNGKIVSGISEALEEETGQVEMRPLLANDSLCYKGSELLGDGFIIEEAEAQRLLQSSARARDVVKQLVNGKEFSSMPDFRPVRWVIDFGEMDEAQAREYSEPFAVVEKLVKPERASDNRPARRDRFWRFGEIAKGLYTKLGKCQRGIARLFTGEYWFWDFFTPGPVVTNGLVVVADARAARFAILSSGIHETWAGVEASSLVTRFRYTPSRCFDTFPFPTAFDSLENLGQRYWQNRRDVMLLRQEGLTTLYNHFHDGREQSADIARLREMHVEMDQAVAAAYGWSDLDLGHGFHETKQGVRYTLSEPARRTILDRLLALNHQRYAEEVKAGLHDKKGSKKTGPKKPKQPASSEEPSLF